MGRSKIRRMLFVGAIICTSAITSLLAVTMYYTQKDYIFPGIEVAGIDVSGRTEAAAILLLQQGLRSADDDAEPLVTIRHANTVIAIPAKEFAYKIDLEMTAQTVHAVGRTGSIFDQLRARVAAFYSRQSVPLQISYDEKLLIRKLEQVAESIEQQPANARLHVDKMKFTVQYETIGVTVDRAILIDRVRQGLVQARPFTVSMPVEIVAPPITAADLDKMDTVLGRYTTEYDLTNTNRAQNIYLAVSRLNQFLVRPQEIFSFNQHVGPRKHEYGYLEAPVFVYGKLIPDVGGGVCQVTSTLYNAVLLADLAIEERVSHFRPPGYVPLGQDATVADGQIDFKFRNNTAGNILVQAEVANGRVTVTIFGQGRGNSLDVRVNNIVTKVVEPNHIIKQDQSLDMGQKIIELEGAKGYQVTVERMRTTPDGEQFRETVSWDEYPPEDRVVRIGVKMSPQAKDK